MKMMALRLLAPIALAGAPASAWAAELVTNGGFETNSLAGFTQSGATDHTFTVQAFGTATPHGGTYQAALGPEFATGSLSQMLVTVPNQTYTVSFWLANLSGNLMNSIQVTFGGVPLLALVNAPAFSYQNVAVPVLATGTQTALVFTFRHDQSFFVLDDVSVQGPAAAAPVPEPATWGLMLLGFGALGATMRRRATVRAGVRFA